MVVKHVTMGERVKICPKLLDVIYGRPHNQNLKNKKQKISEQSSVFHQSVAKKEENDNNVWNNIEKL